MNASTRVCNTWSIEASRNSFELNMTVVDTPLGRSLENFVSKCCASVRMSFALEPATWNTATPEVGLPFSLLLEE